MSDGITLTAAEAEWVGDAVAAVWALGTETDYGLECAARVIARARLPNWSEEELADAVAEREVDAMGASIVGAIRVMIATDHGDAAVLAEAWGRPTFAEDE